jgi:hypothetical protein
MNSQDKFFLNETVKFVATQLDLQSLPRKIVIVNNVSFTEEHLSFGVYNTETNEIYIYGGSRHVADVCRTLCHELVHHKQREQGKNADGRDGSSMENEANALAGSLMRQFRYKHPEIYLEK